MLLILWLAGGLAGDFRARGESPAGSPAPAAPAARRIDDLVGARLKSAGLTAAAPCADAVFVRRVYLDVTGTLPTASEAQKFIGDRDPNKRAALVDRLLATEEYADFLTLKWGDLLRIKAEFPINLWPNAAQSYYRWIHDAIRDNRPWNGIARDLLTASGSNFENPPVNFYRAMQNRTPAGIAQTVALTFLGERAENWPSNELAEFSGFFANVAYKTTAEWKEEIVYFNPAATNRGALNGAPRRAVFPDGRKVTLPADRDPRPALADWLVKDPQFARCLANRAWFWLLGRGIVHEPDDFRRDNPPVNPELLDYLASELTASGYDLKKLYRLILNSRTYQQSSIPAGEAPEAVAQFAVYPVRRLEAETLIDAVNQLTGAHEKYSSAIPEPYSYIPENRRSIALPDGSITSPFLELFGKPARDTGRELERNNGITAAQKLWLLNSSQMLKKIESSRMIDFQTSSNRTPAQIATGMYLGVLNRYPTPEETGTVQQYFKTGISKRQATVDLAWALMNTTEFLYRH